MNKDTGSRLKSCRDDNRLRFLQEPQYLKESGSEKSLQNIVDLYNVWKLDNNLLGRTNIPNPMLGPVYCIVIVQFLND